MSWLPLMAGKKAGGGGGGGTPNIFALGLTVCKALQTLGAVTFKPASWVSQWVPIGLKWTACPLFNYL